MELGDPVHVRMSKWGDRPHWEFDALWLGTDDLGHWVARPPAPTTTARASPSTPRSTP